MPTIHIFEVSWKFGDALSSMLCLFARRCADHSNLPTSKTSSFSLTVTGSAHSHVKHNEDNQMDASNMSDALHA